MKELQGPWQLERRLLGRGDIVELGPGESLDMVTPPAVRFALMPGVPTHWMAWRKVSRFRGINHEH